VIRVPSILVVAEADGKAAVRDWRLGSAVLTSPGLVGRMPAGSRCSHHDYDVDDDDDDDDG